VAALAPHNMKEERILYPSIDNALTEEERESIFNAMRERFRKIDTTSVAASTDSDRWRRSCCCVRRVYFEPQM